MASILDLVKHYQHAIEKYPNDEQKILKSIDKLFNLGVTVQHLQETGVGRTVNALRKEPGDVGKAARALVYKWKLMVAAEESDHDEDHSQTTRYNGHENEKTPEDSDYDSKHKQNEYNKNHKIEEVKESYSNSKYVNGDYSGGKRKHQSSEEEEPYIKKSRHVTTQNEVLEKISHVAVKREPSETEPDSGSTHSDEGGDSDSENSESYVENKSSRQKSKTDHNNLSSTKHSVKQERHIKDSSSSRKSYEVPETLSKHSYSESRHVNEKSCKDYKSSSSDKYKKEKDSSQKKESSDHKSPDKEKKKKESKEDSSSRHRSSSDKHKHSDEFEKSKSHSEKSSSKSERHSSSSYKEKSEKDKHKHVSDKSSDKYKSKAHSSGKDKHHSSSKEKAKEKESSSKDKENSHKSDKKRTSSSDTSAKDNVSRSKGEKVEDHKRSNSDRHEKKSRSSHSSKSSSSSKSKDTPKKKKEKENNEDGIDCGSGASFAEALGMISPSKPKKKSASSKDTSYSPNNSASNDNLTPAALLAPNAPLAPLPALEISALPEISPNYKPRPPPKFLPHFTEEDAISAGISSKNQRTKVYSGNKILGKIPSLYEMCVQILQEHIDALEYTGGVPYEILKPVVDKATPQQLYMLEHFNPYLMEDTDHLWQKFCEKSFRSKKRQELESWREMFIRCQEEQEHRLKSLTANIKIAQEAKKAPIKQTKMAYVDTVVKPPRNIARKQAQHGTAFAASASPAARVAALAAAPNVLKGSARPMPISAVPSAAFQKPKKAPLMQKALQFMRGRKR